MILYLDASALVKLYVEEEGSDTIRRSVRQSPGVFCHLIAYAEVRAALAKARRMLRLPDDEYRAHVYQFERDWKNLEAVLVDAGLVRRAGEFAERFELRAYDSVHLAGAERVFDNLRSSGTEFGFAAFDKHLCTGAELLGMNIII